MNDEQAEDRATMLSEKRTALSVKRTIIAAERTLMAWIRTAISMIGFGFTIYNFFKYLETAGPRPQAPRNLALTLIALGTVGLIMAVIQHRQFLQDLGTDAPRHFWTTASIVSVFVVLIGVLAFIGVLAREGPF